MRRSIHGGDAPAVGLFVGFLCGAVSVEYSRGSAIASSGTLRARALDLLDHRRDYHDLWLLILHRDTCSLSDCSPIGADCSVASEQSIGCAGGSMGMDTPAVGLFVGFISGAVGVGIASGCAISVNTSLRATALDRTDGRSDNNNFRFLVFHEYHLLSLVAF